MLMFYLLGPMGGGARLFVDISMVILDTENNYCSQNIVPETGKF